MLHREKKVESSLNQDGAVMVPLLYGRGPIQSDCRGLPPALLLRLRRRGYGMHVHLDMHTAKLAPLDTESCTRPLLSLSLSLVVVVVVVVVVGAVAVYYIYIYMSLKV